MEETEPIQAHKDLISYCGFYCGACPKYLKKQCKGCKGNTNRHSVGYTVCKVKPCCSKNGYFTCADCEEYKSVKQCMDYNPLSIRFGQFLTRTNRRKGIEMIKEKGPDAFVEFMVDRKWVTMKTCS